MNTAKSLAYSGLISKRCHRTLGLCTIGNGPGTVIKTVWGKGVSQVSLVQNPSQLSRRYRDAILTRRLEVGTTITLDEEARDLGVAKSLLSRALRLLVNEGLMEWQSPNVAVVRPLTTQSLQDIGFTMTRRRE